VRKQDNTEAVSGVGDEAYFHNNSDRYAELYVKVGERALTLQASGQGRDRIVEAQRREAGEGAHRQDGLSEGRLPVQTRTWRVGTIPGTA
jgi:hypothetical protein